MEQVAEEADVLTVVAEVRSRLVEVLYRNPDPGLESLLQLAGPAASERLRRVTDRRERISLLVDHFRSTRPECARFVHIASMQCELPLDLESRLLSAAGCHANEETPDHADPERIIDQPDEHVPQHPGKRLRRDYVESYSTAVKTTLLQKYERVTKGVAREVRLDRARVILQHRTTSRQRERSKSLSLDSEDSSTEDVVTVQSLLSSLSKSPLTVLLGPAGSGKTVLMHCVGQQWARGELPDFHLLFLLEFRQLNLVTRKLTLIELLFHFFPWSDDTCSHTHREEEEEARKAVLAYMQANPEKVCVIFDGYDEFRSKFTRWKSDASWDPWRTLLVLELFSGLCSGRILRGCSVLVTCRPRNTVDLPERAMEGELLGFDRQQVKEYAEQYFQGKGHKEDSVRHLLASHHILTMCYVPALCHLCCVCLDHHFSQGPHSTTQLPATVTQVYLQILTAFLSKVSGGRPEDEATPPIQRDQVELKEVCQLAMEGLDGSRIVFSTNSVSPHLLEFATRAGFLSQFQLTHDDGSQGVGCAFSHLAMQEFLGALHLMTSQSVEEPQLRSNLNLKSRWTARTDPKTVFTDTLQLFVCGLAAPACAPSLVQLMGGGDGAKGRVEKRRGAVLRILRGFAGNPHLTGPKLVELCCCALETQDVPLARAVAARPGFELRNIRLAPPDMDALAFVVSAAAAPVGLDFAGCSMETECLQALPSCPSIDYLIFRSRKYGDAFAEVLSGVLPGLPALRKLELICGRLTEVGAAKLTTALESCPEISELNLSDNHLRDDGLRKVADKFPKLTSLRSVSLGKNSCSLDGILTLLEKMAAYPTIQAIHTDGQKDFSEIKVLFSQRSKSLSAQADHCGSTPTGRTVRLLNCGFTAEKMNQLCQVLTKCPGMSAIDLSGSTVSLDGLEILTRTLAVRPDVSEMDVRLQEPTKISVLYSPETQRHTPGTVTVQKTEKRLRLVSCGLRPPDLTRLCEALRECTALTLLDVSGNALGDKGLKTLVDFIPQLSVIQEINVSENAVTMEGVLFLAGTLCTCITLQKVEVSHGGKKCLVMKFRSSVRRQSGERPDVPHPQQNGIHLSKKFSLTHSDVQPSRIDRLCGKLSHCPEQLELNFSHSSLSDVSIEKLLQRLPHMATLQLLQLNHVQMSTEGALLLVRSLIDCQRVKAVELRSQGEACIKFQQIKAEEVACKLTQYQLTCGNVEKLSGILQQCPRISDLDLSGSLLRDEGVRCFVEFLPKLQISNSVKLNDNRLTQTGALCLANSITVCKRVMAVEVSLGLEMKSLIRFIQDNDSGKALSLRECCFGTSHLQKLADILQNCPHLHRLELCCNTLPNEGFQILQRALSGLPSLQLLGIRKNGLSAQVIKELLKELGSLTNHLEIRIEEPWIKEEAAVQLVSSCLDLNSSITKIRVYKTTVSITLEKEDTMTTPLPSRDDSMKATSTLSPVKSIGLVDCDLQGHHLQFLQAISQNCPVLQELDLSQNSMSREGAEFLSATLPSLPDLRRLRLGSKQTSEDGVEILTQGLSHCHSIESLSLAHHVINDRGAATLSRMLPRLQNLRAIDLSYCSVLTTVGSHDLLHGLRLCAALEDISLDSVQLDAEGISLLAAGLQHMASVRRLILNKIAMTTGSSEQGGEAIMVLLRSLEGFHRMEEIELDEIWMGDHGVQELVRHLRTWLRLRRISLSKNFVSDTGGELLVETLGHCTTLEEIILSRNSLGVLSAAKLGQVLPVLPQLRVLDLSENHFGAEGAVKLSESLVQMKSLQKLKLISIGTQELTGLAASLRHCVCAEEVSLAWNGCDDSVALKLAEVLPQCQKLKCLDLECNKISLAGAEELAKSLRSCPSVEVIRLWKNHIGSEAAERLGTKEPRLNFSST
ncbi:protein NLRC5 [Anguilla anguilla]|uniref:protein NLRC5 n=1 Tax=Anguilla anguilla TaxID=7936 RepID=UPI0015AC76C7|nr:protein NLRC5 [Anguilla anguilla]